MAENMVSALPWIVHSLHARTGAPHLPQHFVQYLVQSCIAALLGCAEACYDQSGGSHAGEHTTFYASSVSAGACIGNHKSPVQQHVCALSMPILLCP